MVAVTSHASSGPLPRGVRELSLPELLHAPASALSVATGVTSQHVREELRQRLAIAIGWPGALALLGWRLGRHRTEAGRLATVGWWAAIAVTALALLSTPLRHVSYLSAAPALFPATVWLAAAVALRPKTGRARVSRGSGRDRHAKAPGRGAGYP